MNEFIDIRVVGNHTELKEFVNLCKVIQRLGRCGASRTIKLDVDGDGSGRLAFYGINHEEQAINNGKFSEFNSEGIDVDKVEELSLSIGE